jgi:hypothetical protein
MSRWADYRDHYLSDEEDEYQEVPFHREHQYGYDYQWYHTLFPEEWALSHLEGTGPGQCGNCADYGCINGVFIGYCGNCAIYDYKGSRGRGFMGDGKECQDIDYPSAFDTYLSTVTLDQIREQVADQSFINIDNVTSTLTDIPYNEDDYINADPYLDLDNNMVADVSILNVDFEGGYNDW